MSRHQFDPVLLVQGFKPFINTFPGAKQFEEYTISTDRGSVYALDLVELRGGTQEETAYNFGTITLDAGGQQIWKREPVDRYGYRNNLSFKRWQQTDVVLHDAQTLDVQVDNSNPVGTIALTQAQVLAFYTTPQHDIFKKEFCWGKQLGLKRQSFLVDVPVQPLQTEDRIVAFIDGRVPRNNGPIIAVSLLSISDVPISFILDLSINGVKIIEDTTAVYWSRFNKREPWIFKANIQPGATFKLDVTQRGLFGNLTDTRYFVTFYFAN